MGKTTLSRHLAGMLGVPHIELARLVKEKGLYKGYDDERSSYIVDVDAARRVLGDMLTCKEIVDTHVVACIPPGKARLVVVLRLDPLVLKERLEKRGYSQDKVRENVEAEVLGVVLADAVEHFGAGRVKEVDLTGLTVEEALSRVVEALSGGDFPPGRVDWLEKYWHLLR